MRIDAVAFDLDGTLYSRGLMYRLSLPLLARHPGFVYHFHGVRREIRTLATISGFHGTQARLLAVRLGVAPERARALIERIIYEEWTALLKSIRPFPHVRTALERLKAAGLKIGLLSDYPVAAKLRYLGLEGLWDASFCSEDTGYLKPHPLPFHRLARELGVDHSRILYIGDSLAYDVRGAGAVGMHTGHVALRGSPSADLSFVEYRRLPDLVAGRFS